MRDGAGSWHLPGEALRSRGQLPTPRPQPPRSPRRKANPQRSRTPFPDIRLLLEYSSQIWGAGREELGCGTSKRTTQSQEEIHVWPKARAKWDHGAASSCSGWSLGAAGLCEANLGSNDDKLQGLHLRPWSGKKHNQKTGSPGFKRGKPWSSAFKRIIFWTCPKRSGRATALENDSLQFCGGAGTVRSTYRTYPLAAVWCPQLPLTECIHSSLPWRLMKGLLN